MGKLLVLATVGVVGTGASLTGAYMFGAFQKVDDSPKKYFEELREINPAIAKTLSDFKASDGGDCAQSLFPGLEDMGDSKIVAGDTSGVDGGYFDRNKMEEAESCLVVNWDKNEYRKDDKIKGLGNFRFLWAAKQSNDRGFAVFSSAKTMKDAQQQFVWEGIAYALSAEEKDGKKSWRIVKKKSLVGPKKTYKNSADEKFPKPHPQIIAKDFWGFMKEKWDMERICGPKDCNGDATTSSFKGYGVWEGSDDLDQNQQLGEGTPNLADFGNDIYNKYKWEMTDVVKGMKGRGRNEVLKIQP